MKLERCGPVIMAAMHLYNFLVDEREGTDDDKEAIGHSYFSSFNVDQMFEEDDSTDPNAERLNELVTDNDAGRPRGRPTSAQQDAERKEARLETN